MTVAVRRSSIEGSSILTIEATAHGRSLSGGWEVYLGPRGTGDPAIRATMSDQRRSAIRGHSGPDPLR